MNWTPTQVEVFQFQREMRLEDLHKKNLVKAKKIIVDSFTKIFEGKNINQNMALRKQLKNVNIQDAEELGQSPEDH